MTSTEENISILKDSHDRNVALKGVRIRASLHELVAVVEVEQSYLNPHKTNIETTYTFPLPIGAVLLGMEVDIAGKKLSGHVIERKKAERDYEDAVTDGNSAVILNEVGPGLYNASIGNLMANETAVIRYRYALMLSWLGAKLRFVVPTTIAPRYGDASAAGIEPHQTPKSSLTVEYPLSLTVVVEGALASATIASPSHSITFEKQSAGLEVRLSGQDTLDRDFILTLESEVDQSSCVQVQDDEEHVAVASIRIPQVEVIDSKPLAVKLLIDCSGSMGGTSIIQARKAALEILNALSPTDSFNVTLFGSDYRHLFARMVPATDQFVTEAWNQLQHLDADMGGTEMEQALVATFSLVGSENPPCVLLITDGEIHAHEKLVRRAAQSAHRIFTVGVGTAIADAFLESLARTTGGACELVSPQEGMAEKILSQFHRLRQPKLEQVQIQWPMAPEWTTLLPEVVFAGDTVHVFAGFKDPVDGMVTLSTSTSGREQSVAVNVLSSTEPNLPRIAAANRLKTASGSDAVALALKYQLLSKWTSYLVVAEREQKANDLPELHHVPQMLAAGWGGTSIPMFSRKASSTVRFGRASVARALPSTVGFKVLRMASGFDSLNDDIPFRGDTPSAAQSRPVSPSLPQRLRRSSTSPKQFIEKLGSWVNHASPSMKLPTTLAELESLGLGQEVVDCIRALVKQGHQELSIVIAFLNALADSAVGDLIERNLKRQILKRWKEVSPGVLFNQEMKKCVVNISEGDWDLEIVDDDLPF